MSGGGTRLTRSGHHVFSLRQPLPSVGSARAAKSRVAYAPSWPSTTLLLPPQGQQLGVDGEDLAHRFLELPSLLTRWRTHATHSSGIRSTRLWPWSMKVSDQTGWPFPWAQ